MNGLIFIAAALTQNAQATVPVAQPPISATINNIPPVLTPIVKQYVDCLDRAEERLSQQAGPLHAAEMRRIVVDGARSECFGVRLMARSNGIRALANDIFVPTDSRESVVDAVLAKIDQSDEIFLQEVARRDRPKEK